MRDFINYIKGYKQYRQHERALAEIDKYYEVYWDKEAESFKMRFDPHIYFTHNSPND